MRWMVLVVMVAMAVGEARGQEAEPFPLTGAQMKDLKPNSPEEATFAKWLFNNMDKTGKQAEGVRAANIFGIHKKAGLVVMAVDWKDHKDKMAKPDAGNKFVALDLGIMVVEGEHTPNPLYVKVQCEGAVYETAMMATPPKPHLGTTSVMAGESVTGWVVVEVPASATAETCKWAWDVPIHGRTPWTNIVAKK